MSATSQPESTASVMDRVDSLRRQLAGLVTLDEENRPAISWGCPELDQFMPGGALLPGMIIELLYAQRGSSAGSLAMHCAKQTVVKQLGPLVVVDRARRFYPPAAIARGIETRDLIVVRPPDEQRAGMSTAEELWALDQAIRCSGVAVVMAWIDKIDPHAYRRLQLAAEAGQTLALLIRPERVRALATWADVQLLISPRGQPVTLDPCHTAGKRNDAGRSVSSTHAANENRYCRVTLLRQRGRAGSHTIEGANLDLEINEIQGTLQVSAGTVNRHAASTMHRAPRVAHTAAHRRSAGA